MINIINIQADDIFIEKFPQTLFEAKQITWFQIFLLRVQQNWGLQMTLPLALSHDYKFMTQTKVERGKEQSFKLEGLSD